MTPVLVLMGSYLLGSLPIGLMIARWWARIDVREHGSGNIGATNVYRVVGKRAGALVFVLDVLKGYVPPIVAVKLGLNPWWAMGAGLAAILGHNFSPFLGFKGGKGVSTGLGVLFGIAWEAGLTGWAVWGIVLAITGFVSLGSIAAALVLAPLCWYFRPGEWAPFWFCVIGGIFTIYKHRGNIERLRNGTEFGFRNRPPEEKEEPEIQAPPDDPESETTEPRGEPHNP